MSDSDTNTPPEDSSSRDQNQSRKVGLFPRLSLKKAQELPQAVYKLGEGEAVRRLAVFDELGRSAESGPSRMLVTTAGGGYGLTAGGYAAERLGITTRGIKLVSGTQRERRRAAYEALFSNEIFDGFIGRFNQKGFPIDDVAVDYLRSTFKLSDSDAKACLSVIRENVNDWILIKEFSGKKVLLSREMAEEDLGVSEEGRGPEVTSNGHAHAAEERSRQQPPRERTGQGRLSIGPQIHFNIQVHLPESATPEGYDAIFRSIAKHLLKQEVDDGDE